MAKEVEVIFTKDKKGFFRFGQKKKVKLGYARNFLIPNNYAVPLTPANLTMVESVVKKAEKQQVELKKQAEQVKKTLEGEVIVFEEKARKNGKLYGSVTSKEIASHLFKNYELDIDKTDLKMPNHIKSLGEEVIEVSIHPDVRVSFKIVVKAQESEEDKKLKKAKAKAKEEAESDIDEEIDEEEYEQEV